MKFENIRVMNFENAFRGMRNPKNSWHLSDSVFGLWSDKISIIPTPIVNKTLFEWKDKPAPDWQILYRDENEPSLYEYAAIGPKDMKLAKTLIKAGSEHRKFMRQIFVSVDITAPLYWWKEFDTYKVATVANSTSTMHKIASAPITRECFEIDDFHSIEFEGGEIDTIINYCENLRQEYLKTNDKKVWKELIRWLPESFLQKRTVTMNYENLLGMCSKGQRRFHKLNEWSGMDDNTLTNFIQFVRKLPYAQDLIFIDEEIN